LPRLIYFSAFIPLTALFFLALTTPLFFRPYFKVFFLTLALMAPLSLCPYLQSFFLYKNTLGLQASESALLCAFFLGKNTLGLQASEGALLCAVFFFRQIPLAIPQIKDLS